MSRLTTISDFTKRLRFGENNLSTTPEDGLSVSQVRTEVLSGLTVALALVAQHGMEYLFAAVVLNGDYPNLGGGLTTGKVYSYGASSGYARLSRRNNATDSFYSECEVCSKY